MSGDVRSPIAPDAASYVHVPLPLQGLGGKWGKALLVCALIGQREAAGPRPKGPESREQVRANTLAQDACRRDLE
jgi:hypothetical protein